MPDNVTTLEVPIETGATVDQVIHAAKARNLQEIIIIGIKQDGSMFSAQSNNMSRAEANWYIDQAKQRAIAPLTAIGLDDFIEEGDE